MWVPPVSQVSGPWAGLEPGSGPRPQQIHPEDLVQADPVRVRLKQ